MTYNRPNLLPLIVLVHLCPWLPVVTWGRELLQPVSLDAIGVRTLIQEHPELTGQRVTVGMIEISQPGPQGIAGHNFLPNLDHQALKSMGSRQVFYFRNPRLPAGPSSHATMIAGILLGNDSQASLVGFEQFVYLGIVPSASLNIYETKWFIYQQIFTSDPDALDADILTISWGSDANDEVTRLWQRGFDDLASRRVVVAACGNGLSEFASISKPSNGYNVISVGAAQGLGDFPQCLRYVGPPTPNYISFGPTKDSRSKPDVLGPARVIGPSSTVADEYSTQGGRAGYSSFAAPHVAGVAALLVDTARLYGIARGEDPRLIKALILNGANKLVGWHKGLVGREDDHEVPLDCFQGAGLVNAYNSHRQLRAGCYAAATATRNCGWDLGRVSLEGQDPNSTKVYVMPLALEAGEQFKATLCWNQRYDRRITFSRLPLSHLVLELWRLDDQGQIDLLLDVSNSHRDNLQHIYYHSLVRQEVGLVIHSGKDSLLPAETESYALAYCGEEKNWSGDLQPADLNADGIVDAEDVLLLFSDRIRGGDEAVMDQSAESRSYLPSDLNLDGVIDLLDLKRLLKDLDSVSPWYSEKES